MSSEGWCWWVIACLSACEKDADDSRKRLEIRVRRSDRPNQRGKNSTISQCMHAQKSKQKYLTFHGHSQWEAAYTDNTLQRGTHAQKSRWTCKSCPRLCLALRPSWSTEWRHSFIFGIITVKTQETGLNLWPVSKRPSKQETVRFHCWVRWMDGSLLFFFIFFFYYSWWSVSDAGNIFLKLYNSFVGDLTEKTTKHAVLKRKTSDTGDSFLNKSLTKYVHHF